MRTLLIGTLAASLVGCSRLLPPEACTDAHPFACFNSIAASQPIEPTPASSKTSSATTKVRSTIAAKTEDPAAAEFGEMKRAIRKNTFGQPVDTICGRVKGKKASGEETGDRPFLYLVKDDDAYVVDGPAGSAAATAYRNICN